MRWIECQHDGETKRVVIGSDPISVGRAVTCDFSFPDDRQVSRMHAIIEKRNDNWFVIDQKSTNGSFVNAQRVTVPFPIKDGDLIEIGEQRLFVKSGLDFRIQDTATESSSTTYNYYAVLRIPPTASQQEIDDVYEELLTIYDTSLHPGSRLVKSLREEVHTAYSVVGDPDRRAEYDSDR